MFVKKIVSLLAAAVMITGVGGTTWYQTRPIEAHAVTETAQQADHSELLTMCRGNYAYNDLGKKSNGKAMQQFYDKLFEAYSKVWTDGVNYEEYPDNPGLYVVEKVNYKSLGLTADQATACYYALRSDNPVMYYLINYYATSNKNYFCIINKEYINASVRETIQQQIYDYVISMTSATEGYTRRYERALILHDKMLPLVTYNYDDMSAVYSHNIVGTVVNKTGVCESYAKAYQMLLNYVGIDNLLVIGTEKESGGGHAWNAVKMDDGTYYFTDPTWDDKRNTHRYFAKGYTVFNEGHTVKSPVETGAYYYYSMPSGIPTTDYNCQSNSPTLYNQMQDYSFYINKDNTITIVSYLGSAQKVNIPSEILGFPVTGIGADAFFNCTKITELILPDTLKTIERGAFFHALTKATSITIPKSVTTVDDYSIGWKVTSSGGSYSYDGDYSVFKPGKISTLTICCYKNSAAHKYAVKNGFSYTLLEEPAAMLGDVNNDKEINIKDVALLKQYLAKWNVDIDKDAADANGDGEINIKDLALLKQYIAKWNVKLGAA
ncbi:MAG: leucine-rich repeat protein [Ruminococcus sp.]|nr:leucine-rich repeat protein [Ruminococcus sp.]